MKQFLILAFVSCSIFNQFGLISADDAVTDNNQAYSTLLKKLGNKLGEESDLDAQLRPLFTLSNQGPVKIQDGSTSNRWVESYKKAVTLPYDYINEIFRKTSNNEELKAEVEAYKQGVIDIGKIYYNIFLIYSVEPRVFDIPGLKVALNKFRKESFNRESEIYGQLGNMRSAYNALVTEIIAKIDQSVTLHKQLVKAVNTFKKGFKSISAKKSYDSTHLNTLSTLLAPVKGKLHELEIGLNNLLFAIKGYSNQRVSWAAFIINKPINFPAGLGVMGK
ncbi:uncharacterized protein LOC116340669 [Contarinia nasturtii]|uniref:uncharacterized protein LOC116340669 n=1 Tax=Contarinia nasturtii TaxID=265458 RepID=UPI0012D373AD|nr:uncharacterized protein LOC116340669 [Contarinia nasturtii]